MNDAARGIRRAGILAVLTGLLGPAWAEDPRAGAAANPLKAISKDSLHAFRTRPLFAPTRAEAPLPEASAPPVSAPPPPPPPSEPPPLKLVGIVGGPAKLAVIRLGDGTKARIVGTGDTVAAWTVTVGETGIRLEAEGRTVDIALFKTASPGLPYTKKPGASVPAAASGALP